MLSCDTSYLPNSDSSEGEATAKLVFDRIDKTNDGKITLDEWTELCWGSRRSLMGPLLRAHYNTARAHLYNTITRRIRTCTSRGSAGPEYPPPGMAAGSSSFGVFAGRARRDGIAWAAPRLRLPDETTCHVCTTNKPRSGW